MSRSEFFKKLECKDAASRTTIKENAQRLLKVPSRSSDAKAMLDAIAEIEANRNPTERIVDAFQISPLKDGEKRAVIALLENPGHSSEQLSRDAGWSGDKWHMTFGELCKEREVNLWPAEYVRSRERYFYSGILANFDEATRGFVLKTEAEKAFRILGL